MKGWMMISINKLTAVCFCAISVLFLSLTARSFATEIMMDVDVFDHLAVANRYGIEYYGPEQIAELFAKCKSNGVGTVFWRANSQIASYYSELNYNCGQLDQIRSQPDKRHRNGAFAVKVGLIDREGGVFQDIVDTVEGCCILSAWVSCPDNINVRLVAINRDTKQIIAQTSDMQKSDGEFNKMELSFSASSPVRIGIIADAEGGFLSYVVDDVSLTDTNGKEYVKNGSMEIPYMLVPVGWDASEANFIVLNGDVLKLGQSEREKYLPNVGQFTRLQKHYEITDANYAKALRRYDPLKVAVREAKKNNIKIYAWIDPLDDGRRRVPGVGFMWGSKFMEENPQCRLVDKDGNRRWGQLCFGYEKVQNYKTAMVNELLDYGVDGIYLKTAYQHNQVWDGNTYEYDKYVYNDVTLERYNKKWGKPQNGEYDFEKLKSINGDFFYECLERMSNAVHERGKKLCLSMLPADTLEAKNGGWPLDWKKLVEDNVIDELLIEPRYGSTHKGYIDSLNKAFGYIETCKQNNVKLGFDFYLNALAEKRVHSELAQKDPHGYFVSELVEIAKSPVDYIGIYECMYVDLQDYWPHVRESARQISSIDDSARTYAKFQQLSGTKNVSNWALASNGAKAKLIAANGESNAYVLIDGQYSNATPLMIDSVPFTVQIDIEDSRTIDTIVIYPGCTSNAHNPSGECGIKAYRIEALDRNGDWITVVDAIKDAPKFVETDSISEFDFKYKHELARVGEISAVRVIVEESGDTGLRLHCRNTPCIPVEERITNLREIQLFGTSK